MNRNVLLMAAVAVLAASGGYIVAMLADRETGVSRLGPVETPVAEDLVGQRRPDFTLSDASGNAVSAADFDGRIWLANFWATWCAPCIEEMPMLSALGKELSDEGVVFVGIALDEAERAREFAAGLDIDYPILVGETDVILAGRAFGNSSGMLPFSVLVDAEGVIRWSHLGALSRDALLEEIRKLQ